MSVAHVYYFKELIKKTIFNCFSSTFYQNRLRHEEECLSLYYEMCKARWAKV